MPRKKTTSTKSKRPVESYSHEGKERLNNPPVGLVTPDTDTDGGKKTYQYDPHLDPQLVWAGKAEHTSFNVPTVSLHVHERIDPRSIIEAVRRKNDSEPQPSLFDALEENRPIREAIEFYKHKHNWSNRMIAGDSLLVMNSLLEKEGLGGQVQMIYIDPPYGVRYGSNFQPFVNQKNVALGDKDTDLTQEPETIRAFRDTWELGIHSYLTYLRDRLLLARELLDESGSVFVQISDENVHHIRELMDEIFGNQNSINIIQFMKTAGLQSDFLANVNDFILWYAKNKEMAKKKFRRLYSSKEVGGESASQYNWLEDEKGCRPLTSEELSNPAILKSNEKVFSHQSAYTAGSATTTDFVLEWNGKRWFLPPGQRWRTTKNGMENLGDAGRFFIVGNSLRYKRYLDDFPVYPITETWRDTSVSGFADPRRYVVQTSPKVIARCLLMCTDPGDLVFDPTCGSGTTAFVAEQWGRRWITCDTSRVAITLAKQRLMASTFDFYELAHPQEGVSSGFKYKTVPHITLKSIANNPDIQEGMTREQLDAAIKRYTDQETLYDQPYVDTKRARVTGPFTVEAVPAPAVKPLEDVSPDGNEEPDQSLARCGETLRQSDWRDELFKTGIRGKGKQTIEFSRVEPLPGTRYLHADAETKEDKPQRVVVSFGPEHAPLEQRQVALAIEEAQTLVPKPTIIVFSAFQFDSEAAKDIDETNWPGVSLLKAQMNADLLTEDLKKKRASNESFWLIGQPDVKLEEIKSGNHKGKWCVEVLGFDYYNTKNGIIESGGKEKIAMWMIDPDYDGRSLFPRQVFFPMAGAKEGWAKLAKNLKSEIDEDLIDAYKGTVSLPIKPGEHKRIAVKIIDDRGIESLRIMGIE